MDIKKIIREEFDSFGWMDEASDDLLLVGNLLYIDGSKGGEPSKFDEGEYMVIEIIRVTDDFVNYKVRYTNIDDYDERVGSINHINYKRARKLVDTGYWKQWDGKQGLVNEGYDSLDWMDNAKDFDIRNLVIVIHNEEQLLKVMEYFESKGFKYSDFLTRAEFMDSFLKDPNFNHVFVYPGEDYLDTARSTWFNHNKKQSWLIVDFDEMDFNN